MATAPPNPTPTTTTTTGADAASTGLNSPNKSAAHEVSMSWTQVVGESELVPVPGVIPLQCPLSPSTSVAQEQMESVPGGDCSATGNSPPPLLQDTATEAQAESFENSGSGSGGNAVKRPVWNKPNGAMEVGPVMGAVSWPALSESTKASPKSSGSYDSIKTPSDGSVPLSQVISNCMQLKHCHILFSFIFFFTICC